MSSNDERQDQEARGLFMDESAWTEDDDGSVLLRLRDGTEFRAKPCIREDGQRYTALLNLPIRIDISPERPIANLEDAKEWLWEMYSVREAVARFCTDSVDRFRRS
jgi:hypothetical protein